MSRVLGSRVVRGGVNRLFTAAAARRVRGFGRIDPAASQRTTLARLLRRASATRFGRDHGFARIDGPEAFRGAVPLRTYEQLWDDYLAASYPVFRDLTWPGTIPYLALTSGTTLGPTKFIPVSREMLASNLKAARTATAFHVATRPGSRLFSGRLFFLGGSTRLDEPAPGVRQGDLSGIASSDAPAWVRPFTFPPPGLALEPDWDRKLDRLAEAGVREPVTLVGGVPGWLLLLFERVLRASGKATLREVWPGLEVVAHGGVTFAPYRERFREVVGSPDVRFLDLYAASEGFFAFGDPAAGRLRLVLDHGIYYEFVPVAELDAPRPMRHGLGEVEVGVNYAVVVSTCAGLWAHVVGDTVRFESRDPPLLTFTGRTRYSLSAFGEHLILEEVEGALAAASAATGARPGEWHLGPVFEGAAGRHALVVEFVRPPADGAAFRDAFDRELSRLNADYRAHRAPGAGLPPPVLVEAALGGFEAWMRARGKLGGQHKVPRMDGSGGVTRDLLGFFAPRSSAGGEN